MAYENELESQLHKYLSKQSQSLSETILDGSCKSFDEYRERCGKLRALWDMDKEIERLRRERYAPQTQEADDDTFT